MATCPSCGATNVTGKFCGHCGAAVTQQATSAMPTPPPPPGPNAGGYPPQPSWQQPQPGYYGPAPEPPKKSGGGLKTLAIVGGVLLGLVLLLVLVVTLWPDDPAGPPPEPPKPAPVTDTKPPAPAPPTTNNQSQGKPAKYPASTLASGQVDFSFRSYDGFGGHQIVLAREKSPNVELMIYEYDAPTKKFKEAIAATFPIGKLNDANHGPIFNDGKDYAIVPGADGIIMAAEDGDAKTYDGKNAEHILVGDWDADGRNETVIVGKVADGYQLNVWRYAAGGKGEKLGTIGAFKFMEGPQVVKLAGNKGSLLMGMPPAQLAGRFTLTLNRVNLEKSALEIYGTFDIHQTSDEAVTGYAAANIKGKDTLVAAYKGSPSYVELFDISRIGAYAPASLGTIALPDGEPYSVILGKFTQKQNFELLVITANGKWIIYSF